MIISKNIVAEIFSQGRAEAPLEACGYLSGTDDKVFKRYPMINIDKSEEHFSLDPKEQFAALKDIRRTGQKIIAVYHTHPASPARPSEEDVKLAVDPDLIYVIASLLDPEMIKAFKIKEGKANEEKVIIGE